MGVIPYFNKACAQSIGPSTINSVGGRGTIGGDEFEWSIGEIAYVPSSSLIVTQGVLQPRSKSASVHINANSCSIKVFPNPIQEILNIEFGATRSGKLSYRLIDVAGRVVMSSSTEIKTGIYFQQLNIAHLAVASYFLHVSFDTKGEGADESIYTIQKLQ